MEAEPEGPTTDLPPVQKAIDAQWERLRAMELRPDVQALFTPDRERCMPRPAFRATKACEICLSLVPPRLMVVSFRR